MSKIFLCHASEDKKFVEKLAKDLMKFGLEVWFDKFEMKVGESLLEKINEGIMLMCHKETHKRLIDSSLLFRKFCFRTFFFNADML